MTVREAARGFENAGVARTERSIINWCQPNRQGVSRLDCYFEENDHKYFITPQSVDRAIQEELAKARELGTLPNPSEQAKEEKVEEPVRPAPQPSPRRCRRACKQNSVSLSLRIAIFRSPAGRRTCSSSSCGKIGRTSSVQRQKLIDQLVSSSRYVGELETKLLQIEAPRREIVRTVPKASAPSRSGGGRGRKPAFLYR